MEQQLKEKELVEELEAVLVKQQEKGKKDKKLELAEKLEEDLKVDKHLYIKKKKKEDSIIILQKNMQ